LCEECKVPEPFYQGHSWLNNGDVVQSANHAVRVGIIECENLDPLFRNVGDIIGMPIERLIINITSRGTQLYLDQLIAKEVQEIILDNPVAQQNFVDSTITLCQIMGYGKYEYMDSRREFDADDYSRIRILKPFSLPEAAGAYAGAVSVVAGGEHSISYEEISPGLYELMSRWTEYPDVLKEKLELGEYHRKDGDFELERCGTCGCPRAFAGYHWDVENGLIVNGHTGRRMALLGFELMDSLFRALEGELGDTIPRVVVEAQKEFTKTGFYSISEVNDEGYLRTELALRGLGNLREIKIGSNGLKMRIDNVSGHLMTIGMVQGLFEMAFDLESTVDWELSNGGNLEVQVLPRNH